MLFLLYEAPLNVTAFRYCNLEFFVAGTHNLFSDIRCDGHFPVVGKYIHPQLQTCTALVLTVDFTEGSYSSNIVIFNNFLVFNFPFFKHFPVIIDVVLHYQLNAFKNPKLVYFNHRSLMISVNDAKYIYFLPIFRTFRSYYITSINHYIFIPILLIWLQMLVKLFFSNTIIDLLHNLNKYT